MSINFQAKDCFGQTAMEYIEKVSGELPVDAVGLWQIVPAGVRFGLSGDDLTEFVRLCILALLEHGAKPVLGGAGTEYEWLFQPQYGESNEEIVDSVINEWLADGSQLEPMEMPRWLWFALPSPYVGN